ncbi:MAG: phosphoglycerate dehydrogenase [bacterium]
MTPEAASRPRVLVTAPGFGRVGNEAMRVLQQASCDVEVCNNEATLKEADVLPLVEHVDAIMAGAEPITARVIAAAPRLKVIARRGVGYDAVDLAAATARGVVVTTTVGVLSETVADHAFALMLAVARQIPEFHRKVKAGVWDRTPTLEVFGKTLGIVGFGAIGRAVARRGAGFGMRLLAYDVLPDTATAAALGVEFRPLEVLLAESDFVTLHVPLSPATQGLIGEEALRRMKPTAILINTSRGDTVYERALLRALREGRIAGAGLDVFHDEPLLDFSLVELHNVVATPHVAAHTIETQARVECAAAEAIVAVLRGERPPHVVNPEVYNRQPPPGF